MRLRVVHLTPTAVSKSGNMYRFSLCQSAEGTCYDVFLFKKAIESDIRIGDTITINNATESQIFRFDLLQSEECLDEFAMSDTCRETLLKQNKMLRLRTTSLNEITKPSQTLKIECVILDAKIIKNETTKKHWMKLIVCDNTCTKHINVFGENASVIPRIGAHVFIIIQSGIFKENITLKSVSTPSLCTSNEEDVLFSRKRVHDHHRSYSMREIASAKTGVYKINAVVTSCAKSRSVTGTGKWKRALKITDPDGAFETNLYTMGSASHFCFEENSVIKTECKLLDKNEYNNTSLISYTEPALIHLQKIQKKNEIEVKNLLHLKRLDEHSSVLLKGVFLKVKNSCLVIYDSFQEIEWRSHPAVDEVNLVGKVDILCTIGANNTVWGGEIVL